MLIVCPNCQASYRIAADSLGAAGRTVRCARCQTAWFADPVDDVESRPPEIDDIRMPSEQAVPENESGSPSQPPYLDILPNADLDALMARKPHARTSARRRTGARDGVSRPMLAAAVLGVLAVVALFVWRIEVVRLFPQTAALYAKLGLDINVRGLAFREVDATERIEDGVPVLLVTGAIDNITTRPVDVPRLRISIRTNAGREIYVWTVVPRRAQLPPGESLPFAAQLAAPPAEARNVSVRFLAHHDAVTGMQ